VIQAERREEQVLVGVRLVHGVKEVCGEDCQAFVEVSRFVLELCVFLDVIGEAELGSRLVNRRQSHHRDEHAVEGSHLGQPDKCESGNQIECLMASMEREIPETYVLA
jgi:hypothetical protein